MIRRTKWFNRGRHNSAAHGRATDRRRGRALAFEHCESRIALSTNAALGEQASDGANYAEGGLISFDVAAYGANIGHSANLDFDAGQDFVLTGPSVLNVGGAGNLANARATFANGSSDTMWLRDNVKLIESPLDKLQHPEGGHISLTPYPEVDAARLAGLSTDVAAGQVARRTSAAPALHPGVRPQEAVESDSLRGRAVVFDVAKYAPAANDLGDALVAQQHGTSLREPSFDLVSRRQEVLETASFREQERVKRDNPQQPDKYADVGGNRRSTIGDDAFDMTNVRSADRLAQAPTTRERSRQSFDAGGANRREMALAAREAALAEWSGIDATPKSEPDTTASASRSRRVLALAVVLTLGAAPLGRVLRRRAPEMTAEQRPPRRRTRRWRLF